MRGKLGFIILTFGISFVLSGSLLFFLLPKEECVCEEPPIEEPGIFFEELEDGTKVNTSETLKSDKKFQNLKIENINFYYFNRISVIEFEIYNGSDKNFGSTDVLLYLVNQDSEVIQTIIGTFPDVASGERKKVSFSIDSDVVNSYDLYFEEYFYEDE